MAFIATRRQSLVLLVVEGTTTVVLPDAPLSSPGTAPAVMDWEDGVALLAKEATGCVENVEIGREVA